MEKRISYVITGLLVLLLGIVIYNGCNKPIDVEAIESMQSKIDTIYKEQEELKQRKVDTLIIEKNNEKEIIKKLQEVNNYYGSQETGIDTIIILDSADRSPFARQKFDEWILREDTSYYDIPKQGHDDLLEW